MESLATVLGPHAYAFVKYGVSPQDDLRAAVEKLRHKAPHLAKFLEEVALHHSF
ncbi:MAG: hypothetical protein ABWK05_01450 [Pyrobaculum sp.]